jgi:hypothetical protein
MSATLICFSKQEIGRKVPLKSDCHPQYYRNKEEARETTFIGAPGVSRNNGLCCH